VEIARHFRESDRQPRAGRRLHRRHEVNSHKAWSGLGDVGVEALAENYERRATRAHRGAPGLGARAHLSLPRSAMDDGRVRGAAPLLPRAGAARHLCAADDACRLPFQSSTAGADCTYALEPRRGAHRHNAKYLFEGVPEAGGAVRLIAAPTLATGALDYCATSSEKTVKNLPQPVCARPIKRVDTRKSGV
jgi:hypothetical protein